MSGGQEYSLDQVFNTLLPACAEQQGMDWTRVALVDKDQDGDFRVTAKAVYISPNMLDRESDMVRVCRRIVTGVHDYDKRQREWEVARRKEARKALRYGIERAIKVVGMRETIQIIKKEIGEL